jgi:2-polyprenyl-3-methyl-5-hydroxy-6-metoxy-1,4-benzoquinol methylase
MNPYFSHSRASILELLGDAKPNRTLDVGCGQGSFSKLLQDAYNCETFGIEPDCASFHESVKSLDHSFCGSFLDCYPSLPKSSFDIVFFNDVLEHMVDPWQVLRFSRELLIPASGVVVASIPNFLWVDNVFSLLTSRDWCYVDSGILDKTHLRFFTRKSIRRIFRDCGFEILVFANLASASSLKWKMVRLASFGLIDDFLVYQYGIVARPVSEVPCEPNT